LCVGEGRDASGGQETRPLHPVHGDFSGGCEAPFFCVWGEGRDASGGQGTRPLHPVRGGISGGCEVPFFCGLGREDMPSVVRSIVPCSPGNGCERVKGRAPCGVWGGAPLLLPSFHSSQPQNTPLLSPPDRVKGRAPCGVWGGAPLSSPRPYFWVMSTEKSTTQAAAVWRAVMVSPRKRKPQATATTGMRLICAEAVLAGMRVMAQL